MQDLDDQVYVPNGPPKKWSIVPFLQGYFFLIIATVLLWQVIPSELFVSIESFASLHVILEVFAVIVACMVTAISWYSPNQSSNTIVGATLFLGVALLDLFHLMSYSGMPDFGSINTPHKSILFWLAARYLSAIAIVFFVIDSAKLHRWKKNKQALLALTIVSILPFGYFVAVYPNWFPTTFSPETGLTPLKIGLEYGLIFIFCFFAFYIYKNAKYNPTPQDKGLFAAAIILASSEFLFTLYASASDFANFSGHIYKIIAYWVIFQTIFVSIIKSPYRQIQHSENTLKRLANIVAQNRNESLYSSVCDLLYEKTSADYILILSYDVQTQIKPIVLNYYKRGQALPRSQPSNFKNYVIETKLDRRNIMYSESDDTTMSPLPSDSPYKSFISYPLVSETKGIVGTIILASTHTFSLQKLLKETLFIISTRLASELEQAIISEHKQHKKSELAKKLESAREEERKNIARDIHDDLGGSLAALKIDISLLSNRLKKQEADEKAMSKLTSMNSVVDKSIKDMRSIINNLRLGILDDIGMIEALEWTLKETEQRHDLAGSFISDIRTSDIDVIMDETSKTALFRMIAEALTNVVKHADAATVSVELFIEDNQVVARIIDDGKGINESNTKNNSYGIIGMRERADLLGGSISFSSPIDGGTQIDIRIPSLLENIK